MEGIDIVAENIIKIEQVKEEPVDIEEPISIRENDPNQVWCSVKSENTEEDPLAPCCGSSTSKSPEDMCSSAENIIKIEQVKEEPVDIEKHNSVEDDHSHEWCSVKAENIVEDLLAPYCESSTSKNHEDLLCSSGE
ncbi:Protein of unknown function [Gryllus bimaculatus]|nr:Protein of unknown function [Gryllus bimaculatus]